MLHSKTSLLGNKLDNQKTVFVFLYLSIEFYFTAGPLLMI